MAKTAEQIGAGVLAVLKAQAVRNREAGIAVRERIRAVIAAYPASERITARCVQMLLAPETRVSIRRIQEYMQLLRAESSASRFRLRQHDSHAISQRLFRSIDTSTRILARRE
jgi:hypothetical protein